MISPKTNIGTILSEQSMTVRNFSNTKIVIDVCQISVIIDQRYFQSLSFPLCKPPPISKFLVSDIGSAKMVYTAGVNERLK